jgi:alkanesulfonate monooxygenase SsuD/methylene tetrahydromethanopterin reductase-like flavin-dependent oxidoreductase (luciferase family)
MIAIVVAVAFVVVMAGFLYLLALVNAEARAERDQIAAYYIELLLQNERQMANEREMMIAERNSLLERIQRPEFQPPVPMFGPEEVVNEINDDLHLVGTVVDGNPPPDEAA